MFKNISNWYKKDKKIIMASLTIAFVVTVGTALYTSAYSNKVQAAIASEVVRFHVLANSDSEADQTLKLKVRDAVLEEFEGVLNSSHDKEETRAAIIENMDQIVSCAKSVIEENNYNYPVKAELVRDSFPTKVYGEVTLPAGNYEALRIEIGNAEGKNWWCVMYPPLCFVDVTHAEMPESSKEELKNSLTEEEYEIVTSSSTEELSPKIKFKIVEWWQEKKHNKEAYASK